VPPEVTQNAADWPVANKDYNNTRATADSAINPTNVNTLDVTWTFDIPGSAEFGAAPTNPLIAGDVVYLEDMRSNVFAINLQTGQEIWKKEYNTDLYGPEGPALGWGKIFVMKGHYEVAALDINNGNELWSAKLSDKESVGIDIQLTTYGNMVYVSTVPGTGNSDFYTGGGVGVIYALDQQTGKTVWSWSTVDSADIWGNQDVNSGGGAWYPPAIDMNTGIIYWGTGNPAPWPGTKDFPNGSSRPGPNLYTNSMVALDAMTGKLLWYNQVLPHDLFDMDFQNSPILASASINGSPKDIVIGSGKLGKVYAFDRKMGEIYWQTPVGQHQNDDIKELPDGTTRVLPGPLGGVETPMALANGMVYAPIVDLFGDFQPTGFVGDTFDMGAATGELTALDVNTGSPVWNVKFNSMDVGSATVVNGIVFTSTLDGMIYALDGKTGDKLWTYQAPGGINGGPAVAKDYIVFPVGMGPKPQLLAFKLGKTAPETSPGTGMTTATTPPSTSTAAASFKADGIIGDGEYEHRQTFDNGNYELYWSNDASNIYVAMKAKTTGFVSMAVQPGKTMLDADMIFGFVKDGKTEIYDLFSTGAFGPHPQDTELGGTDDILESGGKEENGYTVIEFKRALKTGDKYDQELAKGNNQVLWAYGPSDSLDVKHSARGYGEITID
jgi:outer membrane protein assembly factor BamB